MVSGFLVGSEEHRRRTQRRAGVITVIVIAVLTLVIAWVIPTVKPKDESVMTVVIDSPNVGPGVETGTEVILRGVPVGKVTELQANQDGTSSITMDLQKSRVHGLRENFTAEFRPKNYFGITGIAITDPGADDAPDLSDGDRILSAGITDATMSTMIQVGSDVVNDTLLPDTIKAVDRVLQYTSAFEPLIHTGVVFADVVAQTQKRTPAYLIDRYNEIVEAIPPFATGVLGALDNFYDSEFRPPGDVVQNRFTATMKAIADYFFSLVGTLLKSNEQNLLPLVNTLTELAGIVPGMNLNAYSSVNVQRLVDGMSGVFSGSPGGDQTLKIKVALESLPGLSGPIAGLPTGEEAE